ncbi:MAG: hypothetical protein Q7K25_04175 [Actinomycetota bacterium]|nr:hypothetical protein [Actinomycetota bacterium]
MTRTNQVLIGATALAVAFIWLLPPLGILGALALLAIAPPWGRTITERAIISAIVISGVVALAIPRGSQIPVTEASARLGLSIVLIIAVVLRLVPRFKTYATVPRPKTADWCVAALVVVSALWLMSAYFGASADQIVSGLFFTGWDNQGHFVPFANTYEVGATNWPTLDGGLAWNQWYPSLHTTIWSLLTLASSGAGLARLDLLWPFVQWTAISFALCLGALSWIASDVAKRLASTLAPDHVWLKRAAAPVAVLAFAAFALLGSPTALFNAGFTNFVMGVTITAATAYFASRSFNSARQIGWLLVPLGSLAVIGLWTPLVLGVAPAGLVVFFALSQRKRWLGIVWAAATVLLVAGTSYIQTKAIVNVSGSDVGTFTQDLGAVGTGMVPFNVGLALASPVVVALIALLLFRRRIIPLGVAVAGPAIGILPFLALAVLGARGAELSAINSYYVLKTLNAILLVAAPIYAAIAALALIVTLAYLARSRFEAVVMSLVAGLLAVVAFGYVGVTPKEFTDGFSAAPGIAAGAKRAASVDNSLVGEAIVSAATAAKPYPNDMPLLWDGSGTLPNLWLASLTGVMSKAQQTFYLSLPPFPYEQDAQSYVFDALAANPDMRAAIYWFRTVSGQSLAALQSSLPNQVTLVKVPMRSSLLCQECSLP